MPYSEIKTKEKSNKFLSNGKGIISSGFYLGHNITENISEIEVLNFRSFIFSIPLDGKYEVQLSNKHFKTCTPESGIIILPSDSIHYLTNDDYVNDLMIIISNDQLEPILEKNYNIYGIKQQGVDLNKRNKKVQVIYNLIINNLNALRLFPQLRESYHFKSSIKEIANIFLAELIAESLGIKIKLISKPDSRIVKNAEAIMDANPQEYFSVQEIANKVQTSARNLQSSFKKHREYTPMQFLKERKLYRARTLILSSNSDAQIKGIALNSGYLNFSNFSKSYKILFGELPSETLQQARKMLL